MSVAFGSVAFGKLCVAGAAVAGVVATTLARSLLGFANGVDHDVMQPAVAENSAHAAIARIKLARTRIMRNTEEKEREPFTRIMCRKHRNTAGSGGQIVEESTSADKLRKQAPLRGGLLPGCRSSLYSRLRVE